MSYLRYTNKIDVYNITAEPTEKIIVTLRPQLVSINEINVIIGIAITVIVITFMGFYCYYKKKERNCI
jgi:hypothetical protein